MKKPILLFIGLCLAATITAQEKPAGNGWWNNNPSLVMPIREVGVTGIRPMKEIGVQKTQLDTLVLHENIALSMADVLTFNTAIFIKQYGRATLSTVAFRGTAASHTQVMWNGMRINSPMLGMTDFSMIPSYFVDDATLLHGPRRSKSWAAVWAGRSHWRPNPPIHTDSKCSIHRESARSGRRTNFCG